MPRATKEELRERLAKAREAKKLKIAEKASETLLSAIPETRYQGSVAERQCVMCGVRFDAGLLEEHMMRAHGQTLGEPVVPAGSRPGSIIKPNKGPAAKVPYTKEWAKANLEWEEDYVPPISQTVTWNRLSYRFEAGVPCRAPKVHIAILREYLQNQTRPHIPEEAQRYGVYKGGVGLLPEV